MTASAKVETYKTANEFVTALLDLPGDESPPDFRSRWVFRGHCDANWDLKPAAWRKDGQDALAPLRKWLEPTIIDAISKMNYRPNNSLDLALTYVTEAFAVLQFCNLADELGMAIPNAKDVPELDATVGLVMSMLQDTFPVAGLRESLFVDIPFSFAQHHGIPTRYLDWTREPLVAAFFAVNGAKHTTGNEVCVWAIEREGNKIPWLKWVTVPRGQHSFLHAQHGLFSINLLGDDYFRHHLTWPDFGETVKEYPRNPAPNILQLKLPVSEADEAQKILFKRRWSKAHLMPTFDNVASMTKERWSWY